jgi:hypothetical protein
VFNAEVQMLAERGFAVLQINYRGSAGLGQYYSSSGADREGRAVQRDIADATRWAIEQNITTREQVCIYGRGYGGFAAVKALATNIGMFHCAVAIDGIYDLSEPVDVPENPLLTPQNLLNVPSLLDLADARRAPLARLANIDAPVLLIGKSAQTLAMRDALQGSDKNVEWRPGDDEPGDYSAILDYLGSNLDKTPARPETPIAFGTSLNRQQTQAFQQVIDQMREDIKVIGKRRFTSAAAVRREIRRIVDRYDEDVLVLVDEDQRNLYDDFKPGLVERLQNDIDAMRVQ